MKAEDRGITVLWALGAVAAVLALAVALVLARNTGDDGALSEIELLREFSDAAFAPDEFDDFPAEEGVADFDSFEEAERGPGIASRALPPTSRS